MNVFYKADGKIKKTPNIQDLNILPTDAIIWIDLLSPTAEDISFVEQMYNLRLQTRAEAEEIESSSRYYETEEKIMANSNFLIRKDQEYKNEIVSFIVKNKVLISYRNCYLKSFNETIRKLDFYNHASYNCFDILISIFEIRIDEDADMIEHLAREISNLGKNVTIQRNLDEDVIISITRFQELAMMIRENIIDKQRVISGILKSQYFPQKKYPKLRVMIKDIGSLLEYTTFSFERLEYLQNTFLGLIDLEQNKVIKIFTVVTVLFAPPMFIAGLYGMNFKFMPELDWVYGYPFALGLMLISSAFILLFFRRKKWL